MCWRAARSEINWTNRLSPVGGSSRFAEPRCLASSIRASACRRAVATWSASMPCPTSSRSRPAGPVSSPTGRTSKGISPTSSAGSDGWSRSSSQTGRAASSARQVCGGKSSGNRGLEATSTTLVITPRYGCPGAGDELARRRVPAAEARVHRDVGLLEKVGEPLLGGGVAALLERGVELVAHLVGEWRDAHADHLDDVVAELGVDRRRDWRGAGPAGLALAVALVREAEDGLLELGDGLALGLVAEVAAAVLGARVGGELLGDHRPVATRDELLAGLLRGRLVLDQHVADVGLDHVVAVLGEVVLDQVGVAGLRHQLVADRVERQLGAELLAQQAVGDVVLRQQVLVLHPLGGGLVLDLLDAGVDLALVDGHALFPGTVEDHLELDQALERLAGHLGHVWGLCPRPGLPAPAL